MKRSHLISVATLALVLIAGSLSNTFAQTFESPSQDSDKSLDIERYLNEPVEMVDLKIGDQSIKDRIANKSKFPGGELNTANFKERNGWFKRVVVTMRNVSGKPIYGLTANLHFTPPGTRTQFSLPFVASTLTKQGVAEPGAEITLTVTDKAWNLTGDIFNKHGVNPDLAAVKFTLGIVRFASDLQWMSGQLLRPDPNNPNQWNVVDMGVAP